MKYTCPYCNKPTTATAPHIYNGVLDMAFGEHSTLGHLHFIVNAVTCPDPECKKLYLKGFIANHVWNKKAQKWEYKTKGEWQLLPESNAKVLPDYVPGPIKEDYYEACRIRDLSPKASATLARRCLQGMIRDFWGISKSRLKDEIDALEEKVDGDVWESIDAVRSVGNIGAHMEKDINIIIDVGPEEAQLLIGLIEQLVDEWYVAREDRKQRSEKIKALAQSKVEAKKSETNEK